MADITNKYGQIAKNKRVNFAIYKCFENLCEEDQHKFVKKFREQPHESEQIMHTFRELILGAYLSSRGLRVRHEYLVENKSPDWCILDNREVVVGVTELVNFHIDAITQRDIAEQIQGKNIAVYWRDGNKNNIERLYNCMLDKIVKYKELIESLGAVYIISVFVDFTLDVDDEEIRSCLCPIDSGLFQKYSHVSGVLHFKENGGRYFFGYEQNPKATKNFFNGVFSLQE
jgi:hypothetical protein